MTESGLSADPVEAGAEARPTFLFRRSMFIFYLK
jgi:hypothetical protein